MAQVEVTILLLSSCKTEIPFSLCSLREEGVTGGLLLVTAGLPTMHARTTDVSLCLLSHIKHYSDITSLIYQQTTEKV